MKTHFRDQAYTTQSLYSNNLDGTIEIPGSPKIGSRTSPSTPSTPPSPSLEKSNSVPNFDRSLPKANIQVPAIVEKALYKYLNSKYPKVDFIIHLVFNSFKGKDIHRERSKVL